MKLRSFLLNVSVAALVGCEQNPSNPSSEGEVFVAARFAAETSVPTVGWVEAKLVRPGRDSQIRIASYAAVKGGFMRFDPIAMNDSFQLSLTGYDSAGSARIVRWWTTQGGTARQSPTQAVAMGGIDSLVEPNTNLSPTSLRVGATFSLSGSWSYTTDGTDPRTSSSAEPVTGSLVVAAAGTVCLARRDSSPDKPVIWSDSSCWIFSALDSSFMLDKSGSLYPVVRIGTQRWMAANLNWTTPNSVCYDDSPANCASYGRLYDWSEASTACPAGWHLPTRMDWLDLIGFLGTSSAARALKSDTGWAKTFLGSNTTGFNALPGGYHFITSDTPPFQGIGTEAYFWSGTEYNNVTQAYALYLQNTSMVSDYRKSEQLSVRCLAD